VVNRLSEQELEKVSEMLKESEAEKMVDFIEDAVIIGEPQPEETVLDDASSKAISMLHNRLGEEREAREKLERELAELRV